LWLPLVRTIYKATYLSNTPPPQIAGLEGPLDYATPQNANNFTSEDVAFVNCEDFTTNLDPAAVSATLASNNVSAIVLYTEYSQYCHRTAGFSGSSIPSDYNRIFTLTSAADTIDIQQFIEHAYWTNVDINQRSILEAMSNTTSGGGFNGTQNPGGPSPSTAVAMIILYSITGIITALFLIIIITGAVRAHRHPERYGPRNIMGRPRPTRARGIARAMLDTIPIVKFGDRAEEDKPADVELASQTTGTNGNVAEGGQTRDVDAQGNEGTEIRQHVGTEAAITAAATENPARRSAEGVAPAESSAHRYDLPVDDPALGCSICTDDFEKGQDVRLLPCNHKFHPACIDPWLLNVSGTCPLW